MNGEEEQVYSYENVDLNYEAESDHENQSNREEIDENEEEIAQTLQNNIQIN